MNTNRHGPGSITVAVDHSQHAYDATEWAAELAKALKAPLHLVFIDSADNRGAATGVPLDTWLGMLRVAAWRAGTYPKVMTTVTGPVESAMTEFAADARLLVLGVDLSTHALETALVSALARRGTSPVAVLRGHAPGLGSPLCGPVVVAGGPAVRRSRPRSPPGSMPRWSPSTSRRPTRRRRCRPSWSGPITRGSSSSIHRTT